MPTIVQCPKCDKQLRVPDHLLGKKVRCPGCHETFVAEEDLPVAPLLEDDQEEEQPPVRRRSAARRPQEEDFEEEVAVRKRRPARRPPVEEDEDEDVPDESAPEEDYEDEPRPRQSVDWYKVRTGIGLVLLSICIAIMTGAIGGAIGGAAARAAAPAGGGGRGETALKLILGLMGLAADGTALIGYLFCLSAPTKNNARTLAIVTLVLAAVSLLFTGIEFILSLTDAGQAPGMSRAVLLMIGILIGLIKLFVFLFFLRAVARCLKDRSLAKNIKNLMILYGTALGGFIVTMVLVLVTVAGMMAAVAQQGAAPAPGVLRGLGGIALTMVCWGCVDLLLLLGGAIWYIVTLVQVRTAIGYRLNL
jgi:predicted Zn finger-like uncharacterized protein